MIGKLDQFKSTKPATEHSAVDGKDVAAETVPRKKREPFKPKYTEIPTYWVEQLEVHHSAAMYQLALRILAADFERRQRGKSKDIILSTAVTGLPRQTRSDVAKKMVEAEMIEVEQHNTQAIRVTRLLHMHK
jgi:hypothetical protein